MMQAFRNSAKVAGAIFALLMLIFVLTSVDWSGLTSTKTSARSTVEHRRPDLSGLRPADDRRPPARHARLADPRGAEPDREPGLGAADRDPGCWSPSTGAAASPSPPMRSSRRCATRRRGVPGHPRVPDRQPVRPRQVSALADLQRRRPVPARAGGPVPRPAPALEAAPGGGGGHLPLRRGAVGAVSGREREGEDRSHRHHPAERRPRLGGQGDRREVTAYYRSHQDDFTRPPTASSASWRCRVSPTPPTRRPRARAPIRPGPRSPAGAVRRRGAPRVDDSASAANGGDLGRVDQGLHGPGVRLGGVRHATDKVSPPVLSLRFSPYRDHQPQGRQGQGTPHPDPDRDHRRPPRPARRPGRLARAAGRGARRSGRARHRGAGAHAPDREIRPVQEGTRVQLGNLVVPDAGVWAFPATKPGATSPVVETSVAYYVFRLDSLQPAGVPPLARSGSRSSVR